ncbi:MAG: hypothetical protein R3C30_05775 [Hyphomonadaceae bacterium]
MATTPIMLTMPAIRRRKSQPSGGIDMVISSVSRNLTAHIENLTLTGSANLTASGNSLNTITGNAWQQHSLWLRRQ